MQLVLYIDQTRCTGCYTCVVACKDWHDVPPGPASWIRLVTIEEGKYPTPFWAFLTLPCFHCGEPACMKACPANAITKREEDGIVTLSQELCLGRDRCGQCLEACPYGGPQFGAEENPKMQKCDLCLERWAAGKKPICVESCLTRALDAGPLEEMKGKYGGVHWAAGFTYDEQLQPSVVFKPKVR